MDILTVLRNKPLFQSYKNATTEDISNAEDVLSLKFSQEYKKYLKTFGFATYEGHELTGICKAKRLNVIDVTLYERALSPEVPLTWYVIEQLNIDGIVIWQSFTGEIYQTAPNTEPLKICDSLLEYINQ